MKRAVLAVWFTCMIGPTAPAAAQPQAAWRFDFGAGQQARGYQRVTPETVFNPDLGYGFEPGAVVQGIVRNRRPLQGEFITADAPFRFSLTVPEGDYRVSVTFGDPAAASETVARAESRRLMLERVTTRRGENVVQSFVVNVRNAALTAPPANAPGSNSVRLNDREIGSLSWDDKLTFEFGGPAPKIAAIVVEPVETPRIFLLGDSTVADQQAEPYASWGQMLPRFFGPDVSIANHAESGESLKAFLVRQRLDKVLSQMRVGDWALIQFGHNDQKEQWPQTYVAADTTYRDYLRVYIEEIRRHGGHPVLVTSVQRRTFDANGRIENSLGGYPDAMRAVAAEENIPLIDLHAMSATLYEALGPARAPLAFARDGLDATHHDNYGAYELARCVVRAIRLQNLPIAQYLREEPLFDPTTPDPPETFALPPSLQHTATGPRGN